MITVECAKSLVKGDKLYRWGGNFNGSRRVQTWKVLSVQAREGRPNGVLIHVKAGDHTRGSINETQLDVWYTTNPKEGGIVYEQALALR